MLTLESQKLGPPKFTKSISKLVKFMDLTIDEVTVSRHEASIKRLALKGYQEDIFLRNNQSSSLDAKPTRYEPIDEHMQPQVSRYQE